MVGLIQPPTTIFSPRLLKKLPSFSAIRWVFSEVGLTMFCLKYRPNLPATRFADVPDQPEMVKCLPCPDESISCRFSSGVLSLNRHKADVLEVTGNSPVKSSWFVRIDFIAISSSQTPFRYARLSADIRSNPLFLLSPQSLTTLRGPRSLSPSA